MVFLIQHTQNRDSEAAHLKLNELVRAVKGAKNCLVSIYRSREKAPQIVLLGLRAYMCLEDCKKR